MDEKEQPAPGAIVKHEFAGTQTQALAETASAAVAAQARAAVEARYLIAYKRPRDMDEARLRLLRECSRPGFAATAIYHKPVGAGIRGPSIRLAEAAARALTNLLSEATTVYDDREKRIIRVTVTDLESNAAYTKDLTVEKVVERRKVGPDSTVLRARTNAQGATVYTIEATPDDMLNRENALISKALRTGILRLVPSDLLEEAMARCRKTSEDETAKDPDAARKALVDAFASRGVSPADLRAWLGEGRDLGNCSPAEITELREVYAALSDGETTWPQILAHRRGEEGTDEGQSAADSTKAKAIAKARELKEKK